MGQLVVIPPSKLVNLGICTHVPTGSLIEVGILAPEAETQLGRV